MDTSEAKFNEEELAEGPSWSKIPPNPQTTKNWTNHDKKKTANPSDIIDKIEKEIVKKVMKKALRGDTGKVFPE